MAAPVASTPVWASGTSLALSALSVLGGAAIAVGWLFSAQRSHLRQKLILGLGLTDFTQGVTTLIGSALQLSGNPYRTNSPACNGSGFIYQTCVIANACWTLVIAATTYVTLVHPFSKCTAKLESPYAFPVTAATVLIIALVPSVAITATYDMVNAGGLCWLKTGTRSAQLTLFVPRATALVVVISLYTRLFVFFRRRDVGLLDSSSDRRDGDDHDDDLDAPEGLKRLSVASISARLAAWNRRRSSDTVYTPAPQHTRSMALEAIPASPIQFTQSFPSRSRDAPPPPLDSDLLAPDAAPRPFPTTTPPLSSSFADSAELRGERKPSTVSFGGLDPHSSDESTTADGGGGGGGGGPGSRSGDSPPAPPSSTRSKRLSSGGSSGFPAKLSRGGGRGGGGGTGTGGGSQAHQLSAGSGGRRMSLSPRQVNKRLSMLMAVFPLAYCALVAVAVARLISELADRRPSTALSWASRFLINSIGAIDGILFVFVQAAFKWWCKRDSRP